MPKSLADHAKDTIEANQQMLLAWRQEVRRQLDQIPSGPRVQELNALSGLLHDPGRAADVWEFTCLFNLAYASCAYGIIGDEVRVQRHLTKLVGRHPGLRTLLDMERAALDLAQINPSLEGHELEQANARLLTWLPV